jgi:hypothetical protein
LLTFAVIFVTGQAANLAVAVAVEQVSTSAAVVVFFALFALVVVGGWRLAIKLTDPYARQEGSR